MKESNSIVIVRPSPWKRFVSSSKSMLMRCAVTTGTLVSPLSPSLAPLTLPEWLLVTSVVSVEVEVWLEVFATELFHIEVRVDCFLGGWTTVDAEAVVLIGAMFTVPFFKNTAVPA